MGGSGGERYLPLSSNGLMCFLAAVGADEKGIEGPVLAGLFLWTTLIELERFDNRGELFEAVVFLEHLGRDVEEKGPVQEIIFGLIAAVLPRLRIVVEETGDLAV